MKKLFLFILIISNIAIIDSCKKENTNDSNNTNNTNDTTSDITSTKTNGIIYEGDTFHLSQGSYLIDYLGSEKILQLELIYENEIYGDGLEYSVCVHRIGLDIYTDEDTLLPGTYTFSYSHDPFTFDGGRYFMYKYYINSDGEDTCFYRYPPYHEYEDNWGEIVSGTIKISKQGDIYEINFDGITDYNKPIKVYFKRKIIRYN